MAYYRLYSLDPSDHHIIDVSDFNADSDPAAILQVTPDLLGISRELWNQDRKVVDFPPRVKPSFQVVSSLSSLISSQRGWRWNPFRRALSARSGATGDDLRVR